MAEWREITTKESFKIKNGIGLHLSLVAGVNKWAGHGFLFSYPEILSKEDEHSNDFILYFGLHLYIFSKDDVVSLKLIDSADRFSRFLMRFKDGKTIILMVPREYPEKVDRWISSYRHEFEFYFGDLLFQDADASNKCPGCGSPITDDMDFCGECGRKLK